jgi:polysaccharide biosynthesis protein PslG
VPISIWYDWKNDGPDLAEREHNFGTVTHDLQPKPAYTALQTLTKELRDFRSFQLEMTPISFCS